MQPKDYFTLVLSISALVVSLYNLYAQQFRRRDRVVGAILSFGMNAGTFDRKTEYYLSNIGDNQIVLKEVSLLANGRILEILPPANVPAVIKPGEVLLVDIIYKESDAEDEVELNVDFGLISNRGIAYRLPHHWKEGANRKKDVFEPFELTKSHEGF